MRNPSHATLPRSGKRERQKTKLCPPLLLKSRKSPRRQRAHHHYSHHSSGTPMKQSDLTSSGTIEDTDDGVLGLRPNHRVSPSFNVAPLLRPGLSRMYDKMAGKTEAFQMLWVSVALCRELLWMAERLEFSDGVLLLDAIEWSFTDADLCPALLQALHSLIEEPEPTRIFFYEALAVVSALSFAASFNRFHLIIFTDNSNTVSIFNSLHAKPDYNPLLITAVNILLDNNIQLRVLHVPGNDNIIADAISCSNFDILDSKAPTATLHTFSPPELSSGSKSI
ncbi:hypothetical protein D9758_015593 [Tetrapyrgos nigripes]|uniref:Uncharacterized protein n=1 Tax=Tetrapyrgos nigripes TaxID=182062 RepID=A0A8H5CDT1_9AGAR|nr:hypothetical protein D9758_015593 [Tetrapyrgos nigripes]